MTPRPFTAGDRVILPADPREGWTEQRAVVVEVQDRGMLTLRVDAPFLDGEDDDGLREAHIANVIMEE